MEMVDVKNTMRIEQTEENEIKFVRREFSSEYALKRRNVVRDALASIAAVIKETNGDIPSEKKDRYEQLNILMTAIILDENDTMRLGR